ncbi:hypothetical protein NDU88_009978 [Pleurodeles waltl]|uniref:Uncharacterized protein n=1 Tax=Pleurodeles waltl TaxID=8319 RepID=A0AAV7QYZ3_PLEWA|nr:hypothetical protein NDU88_009978 [Pleurodeles waltl]
MADRSGRLLTWLIQQDQDDVPIMELCSAVGTYSTPRISEFIWNKGRCRVAMKKFYSPLNQGGLLVPNMEQYYLASQLQWVVRWLSGLQLSDTATGSPPWMLPAVLHLFHPLTNEWTLAELLLCVAHRCYRRCLHLTQMTVPYAPALALLDTQRGS